MVARSPTPGVVCRFPFPIEGRQAFYVIDWHGHRSELRIVEDDETEAEVIEHLSAALWVTRPRGASAGGAPLPLPRLRLV